MNKYIQDLIRNKSRLLFSSLSCPQKKAMAEIIRGLFTARTPVLRHLAQDKEKSAKKQGEKYSYHLGNIKLNESVEDTAYKRVKDEIRTDTIIAYDLTDISKEAAKKMEKISNVFDGSRRKITSGFLLHGVGINNMLLKLEVHNGNKYTTNQIRRRIIEKYSEKFNKKGIWIFDRGNDDKCFFKFLRQKQKVQFIARLRNNRMVVIKKTGALIKIGEIPEGRYRVYLMNKYNTQADISLGEFILVIKKHLEDKEPIRLLSSLKGDYSNKQTVNMYLKRWGIENIFKRAKQKFNLEKIRVGNHKKFVNLTALIQFAVIVSTIAFLELQKLTYSLISGVLILYKNFIKKKNLSFNVDSFITFLQSSLKPLIFRSNKSPPNQLSFLSRRQMEKLGSF